MMYKIARSFIALAFSKNAALSFVIYLMSCTALMGQVWQWDNPLPQGNSINKMSQIKTTPIFFACGMKSTLLRSTNSGLSWLPINTPVPQTVKPNFNSIFFVSDSVGYIVGSQNLIMRSNDRGVTWNVQTTLNVNGQVWNDVCFINEDTGIVVGRNGIINRTVDGGITWSNITSPTTNALTYVDFSNSVKGYIAAGNKLLKTTDGGLTWTIIHTFSSSANVEIMHSDTIYAEYNTSAVSTSYFLRSIDGGLTWTTRCTFGSTYDYGPISFINDTMGYVVRSYTQIFKTIDGGLTWNHIYTSTNFGLNTFKADVSPNLLCGGDNTLGSFGCSTDGGLTWNAPWSAVTTATIGKVMENASGQGFVLVGSNFYRTADAGHSWIKDTITWPCLLSGLNDFEYISPDTIYMTGTCGFFRSLDAGITWSLPSPGNFPSLGGLGFLNSDTGAIASAHSILRTFNAGQSWDTVVVASNDLLSDVDYVSKDTVIVSTDGGRVFKSVNAGGSWLQVYYNNALRLGRVQAFHDTVFIISTDNVYLRSLDGGTTWSSMPFPGNAIMDMCFLNCRIGYISASFYSASPGAYAFRTVNGGQSWQAYPDVSFNYPYGLGAKDSSGCILSGEHGMLITNVDTSFAHSVFHPNRYSMCIGDTVHFVNDGNALQSTFEWIVDGVLQSTSVNYDFVSAITGVHHVGLRTITGSYSDYSETTIRVGSSPANFSYAINNLTVSFSDLSGSQNSWSWSFGDSTFSNLQNPIHTYSAAGSYPIVLAITNTCGVDSHFVNIALVTNYAGNTFRKTYFKGNFLVPMDKAKESSDGGIMTLNGAVQKLDGSGKYQWYSHSYSVVTGGISYVDIVTMPGNYCVAAGNGSSNQGVISRIDSVGKVEWSKQFQNIQFVAVVAKSDRIYALGSDMANAHGFSVTALDTSGNILWAKHVQSSTTEFSPGGNKSIPATILKDKSLVVAFDGGSSLDEMVVMRMDSSGNVTWARNYFTGNIEYTVQSVTSDSSGFVYLAGEKSLNFSVVDSIVHNFIIKIDPFSNTNVWEEKLWLQSTYTTSSIYNAPIGFIQTAVAENGTVLITVNTNGSIVNYANKHYVVAMLPNGIVTNSVLDNGYIYNISPAKDLGFLMSGQGYSSPFSTSNWGLIKKVDNSGNPACLPEFSHCYVVPMTFNYLTYVPTVTPIAPIPVTNSVYQIMNYHLTESSYCACNHTMNAIVSNDTAICRGDTISIFASGGTTYLWSPTTNISQSSAAATNVWPNTTTNYSVDISDAQSCSTTEFVQVTVNALPTPIISVNGNILTSNYSTGNQWFFNGNPIAGATQQQYVYSAAGFYSLEVTNSTGCSAFSSNITPSDVNTLGASPTIAIYPNPTNDQIQIDLPDMREHDIMIYDNMGQLVLHECSAMQHFVFSFERLSPGQYEIVVVSDATIYRKTVMVEK